MILNEQFQLPVDLEVVQARVEPGNTLLKKIFQVFSEIKQTNDQKLNRFLQKMIKSTNRKVCEMQNLPEQQKYVSIENEFYNEFQDEQDNEFKVRIDSLNQKENCQQFYSNLNTKRRVEPVADLPYQTSEIEIQEDERNQNNETVLNILNNFEDHVIETNHISKPLTSIQQENSNQKLREQSLSRINNKYHLTQKKKRQIIEEQQRILIQEDEENRKLKLKQLEDNKDFKRKQIMEKLEEDRLKRQHALEINKEGNKIIKQVKNQIEQEEIERKRRTEELLLQELDRRKKALAEKRELHKPISLNQIKEHARKHMEDLKALKLEKEKERIEIDILNMQRGGSVPRSKFTYAIEQEDKELKERINKEKEQKRILFLRKQKYAEVVKDMFIPKIKHPIQEIKVENPVDLRKSQSPKPIEMLSTKNTSSSSNGIHYRAFKSGQNNIKQSVSVQRQAQTVQGQSPTIFKKARLPPVSIRVVKKQFKEQETERSEERVKKPNYLQELREKRVRKTDEQKFEFDSLLNQNNEKLQQTAQKLESEAKRKEQMANRLKDIEKEEEANNLYVQSIKAKLAILQSQQIN